MMNDLYGRPLGKLFDADFFLEDALENGTHACNYLATVDMGMNPVDGFKGFGWDDGFGDFHLVPDLSTLRRCTWREKTAVVQCDAGSGASLSLPPRSGFKSDPCESDDPPPTLARPREERWP